jgi:hypothetical protein
MEGLGSLSGIAAIFILIVAVLAFLMPFFVLRIRNEMISMNQKMSELVKILGGNKTNYSNIEVTSSGKKVKKCLQCGTKNRFEEYKCMGCGEPLL